MSSRVLLDMTRPQVLDHVERAHTMKARAEREILASAYQWAVLHHPDRAAAVSTRARAHARPAGADGTPLITEYAAAAFGARIQTSPYGARRLIADAVDIQHRLPRLQRGIDDGRTAVRCARHVAEATRELTGEQARWVDDEVADIADGRLAWKRFTGIVEGKVAAAAPELARAKELAAARERGIRLSRHNEHGIGTLTIRDHITALLGAVAGIDATAAALEERMPDLSRSDRRLAAFALLTNPQAHPDLDTGPVKPKVRIDLHVTPDSPIARWEGRGPVTTAWVKDMIAHIGGQVRVAPVIDLANQAPVDAYEIPAALRHAVHLIHGGDVFPFAPNTSQAMDLDHNVPWAQGGETSTANLGPLTRTHHRIKTHHVEDGSKWECRQPFPGIVVWRDPYGAIYVVDHTGTRKLGRPRAA